jgi:hypothetical protein
MQLLYLIAIIGWMVWISKDVWKRGMGSGIAIGAGMALWADSGDTKGAGILLMIGCAVMLLFYKLMTK